VGACDDAARDPALSGVAQQTSSSLGRQQSDITTTSSIPQYGFSIDAPGADRSMHRVKNACHHEGRQGWGFLSRNIESIETDTLAEFSGTLLGFDDFVSKWMIISNMWGTYWSFADMVLEDVTE
jgi:hypothetical protein